MEIVDMAWSLFTAVLGVVIGAWVVKRIMFSRANVMEMVDSALEYLLKTKEGQEKIYGMGYLLGKSIMDGTGFKGKAGKGGIMASIEEGIAQFISKTVLGAKGEENQQQSSKPLWQRD